MIGDQSYKGIDIILLGESSREPFVSVPFPLENGPSPLVKSPVYPRPGSEHRCHYQRLPLHRYHESDHLLSQKRRLTEPPPSIYATARTTKTLFIPFLLRNTPWQYASIPFVDYW
jgi:hypothetical protein